MLVDPFKSTNTDFEDSYNDYRETGTYCGATGTMTITDVSLLKYNAINVGSLLNVRPTVLKRNVDNRSI